jgi:hypothetical protein
MKLIQSLILSCIVLGACGEPQPHESRRSEGLATLPDASTPIVPSADAGSSQVCEQLCDYTGCRTVCHAAPSPVTPVEDPYAH